MSDLLVYQRLRLTGEYTILYVPIPMNPSTDCSYLVAKDLPVIISPGKPYQPNPVLRR